MTESKSSSSKSSDEPKTSSKSSKQADGPQVLEDAVEQGHLGEQPEQSDADQDLTVEGVTKEDKK